MTTTPRNLPIEIKRQYILVYWRQFWDHNKSTPIHLWTGHGDRDGGYKLGKPAVLCGKVIDGDSSHDVEPENATYICKACVRIALARAAKGTTVTLSPDCPAPTGVITIVREA